MSYDMTNLMDRGSCLLPGKAVAWGWEALLLMLASGMLSAEDVASEKLSSSTCRHALAVMLLR